MIVRKAEKCDGEYFIERNEVTVKEVLYKLKETLSVDEVCYYFNISEQDVIDCINVSIHLLNINQDIFRKSINENKYTDGSFILQGRNPALW